MFMPPLFQITNESIIGIIIALILALIVAIYCLVTKVDDIKSNTEPIKGISERIIAMDTKLDFALELVGKGTIDLNLKNFGETHVTAEPQTDGTVYNISVEKPFIRAHFIAKKTSETSIANEMKKKIWR
jgi:hypothetical protein